MLENTSYFGATPKKVELTKVTIARTIPIIFSNILKPLFFVIRFTDSSSVYAFIIASRGKIIKLKSIMKGVLNTGKVYSENKKAATFRLLQNYGRAGGDESEPSVKKLFSFLKGILFVSSL